MNCHMMFSHGNLVGSSPSTVYTLIYRQVILFEEVSSSPCKKLISAPGILFIIGSEAV